MSRPFLFFLPAILAGFPFSTSVVNNRCKAGLTRPVGAPFSGLHQKLGCIATHEADRPGSVEAFRLRRKQKARPNMQDSQRKWPSLSGAPTTAGEPFVN